MINSILVVVESCVFGEGRCDFGDCDGLGDDKMEEGDSAFATEGRYFSYGERASALLSYPEKTEIFGWTRKLCMWVCVLRRKQL